VRCLGEVYLEKGKRGGREREVEKVDEVGSSPKRQYAYRIG
jgi:hypothetical protein